MIMRSFHSGVALAKGMSLTFRTMFRKPVTIPYPEVKRPVSERFRGRHELKRYDNGLERCIGCSLCSAACPADAIFVVPAENSDERRFSPGERYAEVYEINMLRCIFCGFCEEACPVDAIVLEHEYELAAYDRREMLYTKDMLLVKSKDETVTPLDTRGMDIPFRMGGMDYFSAPLGVSRKGAEASSSSPGSLSTSTSSASSSSASAPSSNDVASTGAKA
jgi:NADH-quinone oxidoreductase subunit I